MSTERVKLDGLRFDYSKGELVETALPEGPFELFEGWFAEATKGAEIEPNAMALATVGKGCEPSVRMVLLKGVTDRGFIFFTNYKSRKGTEILHNSKVALLFYWASLERQIRIEGRAVTVSADISDRYFASRPLGAQIGAAISPQSSVLKGREELEERARELALQYDNASLNRPEHWGGYEVIAENFEFWQGRKDRLHDRIVYRPLNGSWVIQRLAP